jgi:type II secretory pathway pseudopilin PulG
MRRKSRQRGMTLLMVILAIMVLSVLLAAAFAAASTEARVSANQGANVDAFALAESGLELFMAKRDSFGFTATPPAVSESARVTLSGGYADVVLHQVRKDSVSGRYGYAVRAHGVSTAATLSGTAPAERTVAEYANWQTGTMNVVSAWTALTGLSKNGNSGSLSGTDACGAAPAVPGVATVTNPGYTGPTGPVSGNPPIDNLGTQAQAIAATNIDWNGIVNNNAAQPSITIPPGSWPSFSNPNYWPIIMLVGNTTLPGSGQGTLIVTGNLTINGNNTWNGVLLVGGNLTSNGNNTVDGAVVTGLNVELGDSVPANSVGNGNKTFQYNSCNVAKAMAGQGQLVGYTNAWVDNWNGY